MRPRLYILAALSFSTAALAAGPERQSEEGGQPASPPAHQPDDAKPIVVNGRRQGDRVSIDRRSYDIGRDVLATTGSVADVLRNLPSVDVDLQGNVSLRGQGNVTILVDGKPTAQFSGPAGAQTLQQVPAGRYERVEVITNPSAAFASDGSGGIINLITRRNRAQGLTGSVRAAVDPDGRGSGGLSLSQNAKSLTLSADLSGRRDLQPITRIESFDLVDASGLIETGRQQTSGNSINDSWSAHAGAEYSLAGNAQVGLDLHGSGFRQMMRANDLLFGDQGDALGQPIGRSNRALFVHRDTQAELSYRRTSKAPGQELLVNLSREHVTDTSQRRSDEVDPAALGSDSFESRTGRTRLNRTDLKLDDTKPLRDGGKLAAGFEARVDDSLSVRAGGSGSTEAEADQSSPAFADRFTAFQTVVSSYATWERPMGLLDAQLGARVEWTRLRLTGSALSAPTTEYARLLPSLHLAYDLGADDKLRAAFSKRIRRPDPEQLDPFRAFIDPRHFFAGNPALKPQDTMSAEIGFEHRKAETFYSATFYYHDNRHVTSEVVQDLGGGVLLTTLQNFAFSRAVGAEFVANGRLGRTVTYRLSGNAYRQHFDGAGAAGGQQRRASVLSAKAGIAWQPDSGTLVQLNAILLGKQLLPQGFVDPVGYVGLGLRHKLGARLWGVVTVQDAFATYRTRRVTEAAGLRDIVDSRPPLSAVSIGLVYNFGTGAGRAPGLEDELHS